MTEFKTLPVSDIRPDENQPRKFFDEPALKDLAESIKSKGVLQPILVRPNGKGHIIVSGERRYRASIAAGLKDIPTVVRTLNDEEALEIQFIENIQREDVHPMDEASTFKQMIENKVKPYSIADIAAKINKPESFVAHRLALNNLIPSLQKEFWKNKLSIGQAVIIARLSAEDQKEIDKEERDYNKEMHSVSELKQHIERNVMKLLSKAPFKKDDATLNPEMGACTTCVFRSGANGSLFNDVKETDRCFKPSCFEKKIDVFTERVIAEELEHEPDTVYLIEKYTRYKPSDKIMKLLEQYNIKPLAQYDDFGTYINKGDKKVKGLWINGDKAGGVQHIVLHKKSNAPDKKEAGTTVNTQLEIDGIKQRTARAAELDDEKVWSKIHSEIINTKKGDNGLKTNEELINEKPLSKIDTAALLFSMFEKGGSECDQISKMFGVNTSRYLMGDEKIKLAKKFLSATPQQVNMAMRHFIKGCLDLSVSSHTSNGGLYLLKQVAEQYKKKEIEAIEASQQAIREKRENRSKQRIDALKVKSKPAKKEVAAAEVPIKKKSSVPVKKKSAKKSPVKKTPVKKTKGKGIKALLN